MSILSTSERCFAAAVSRLAYCNPFLPERIDAERDALDEAFDERAADWNRRASVSDQSKNIEALVKRAQPLVERVREQLAGGMSATPKELELYEDLCLFVLYHAYRDAFAQATDTMMQASRPMTVRFYEAFEADAQRLLGVMQPGSELSQNEQHLFACLFQLRRAFLHIAQHIVGTSEPAVRLRGAAWQSIFTHDMRRYRRGLYQRMGDITTLVTGPSGTGKELVARAIGMSRYIPFNGTRFAENFAGAFYAVNLSALSPTLIESELFGHARGSFTGAVADRAGWLETCPPLGAVFLDEIGELEPAMQVKLLRVIQTRSFQRLGETKTRHFAGKIIAATNRDLLAEIEAGTFREDFYYRLCSDLIVTPSLKEQIDDRPEDLEHLVAHLCAQMVGSTDADSLCTQVLETIDRELGRAYAWPGNVRELEQCVRNVLIRGSYRPATRDVAEDARESWMTQAAAGALTAEQLLSHYCKQVYQQTGSYQATAKQLELDRRTVRRRVEQG